MKVFHSVRTTPAGEIGFITEELDDPLYLAMHPATLEIEKVGLFIPADKIEILEAVRPDDEKIDIFVATEWSKEFDERISELVDTLISLRFAHPKITQFEIGFDSDD